MSHYSARMSRREWLRALMIVAVVASSAALAQEPFPSKPIRLVVPTVGGTVDLIARYVAPKLSEAWGQPVVVDTKAGASGNIAAALVAKAPADGYTILAGYNPLAISAALHEVLQYDLAALTPVTLAVSAPQILVVHPGVPAANIREFIALAKARNGAMSYASISPGSASHLTMELFNTRAGIQLVHVPYKGAAPAINDLLGMHVQAGFFAAANVIQHVKTGQLRALAVTGGKRLTSLPNLPTIVDSGFPMFDATIWIGFLLPAGTPAPIIEKYNREIVRILRLPDVRVRIEALDFDVIGSTPEAFGNFIRSEITTWSNVAKKANVRLD